MIKALVSALITLAFVISASAAELVKLGVVDAKPTHDAMTGTPVVEITLSEEGRAAFADFSRENVGKRIEVLIDDDLITSPFIHSSLDMPIMYITGPETMAVAIDLATRLTDKRSAVFVRPEQD